MLIAVMLPLPSRVLIQELFPMGHELLIQSIKARNKHKRLIFTSILKHIRCKSNSKN